mgnify:CR=1 FL=1
MRFSIFVFVENRNYYFGKPKMVYHGVTKKNKLIKIILFYDYDKTIIGKMFTFSRLAILEIFQIIFFSNYEITRNFEGFTNVGYASVRPFSYVRPFLYFNHSTSARVLRHFGNLDFLLVEKCRSK